MKVSAGRNKTDFLILGILGIITTAILLVIIILSRAGEDDAGTPGVRTTHTTDSDALMICYELLERLEYSVRRSEKILQGDVLDEMDVLFLLDPLIAVEQFETREIKKWLNSGGVLICTQVPEGLHYDFDALGEDIARRPAFTSSSAARYFESEEPVATFITDAYGSLPLALDISEIYFEDNEVINDRGRDSNVSDNFKPLLSDNLGTRIVEHDLGLGRIIVLSDCSFLANGQIGKGDNSVLAVNLVAYALSKANGDSVVFDEYHFGYGSHETGFGVLLTMLFNTTAGWSVLSLTIAGLLYMLYKGRRFGYRHGLGKKYRRSKLEYVHSVGSTYKSAGANRLTLELIYKQIRQKTTSMAGLAASTSNLSIANEIQRRHGCNARKCKQVFDHCDKLLVYKKITQRQLMAAIKQLAWIETEVFNEQRNSK